MKTNYSEFLEQTMERIGNYGKANPDFMGAFFNLRQVAGKPGALSTKPLPLNCPIDDCKIW